MHRKLEDAQKIKNAHKQEDAQDIRSKSKHDVRVPQKRRSK